MRVLNTQSIEFKELPNHEDVTYAILSHTWADEEVLFHELEGFNAETTPLRVKQKLGYKKIEACCNQAVHDGFAYVWIDTCCIDKRSSAELSEAINSMYQWYSDCAVCYAYLADVPNDVDEETQLERFKSSKWFTRGWTLQELIAPFNLEFYGDKWHSKGQGASLGTKRSLQEGISQVTRIPIEILKGPGVMRFSIAEKMSWAARRTTTRVEDRAYSLLGLFNVNMPLLYGEGRRAFIRLQEEIMKASGDESIFAWERWENQGMPFQGLLAMSPDCFSNSGNIIGKIHTRRGEPHAVTNRGLRLEVMLRKTSDIHETRGLKDEFGNITSTYVAILNASKVDCAGSFGIILGCLKERNVIDSSGDFVRLNSERLLMIQPTSYSPLKADRTIIFARIAESSVARSARRDLSWLWKRSFLYQTVLLKAGPNGFFLTESWPRNEWEILAARMVLRRLLGEVSTYESTLCAALLFDDGQQAFAVYFGFGASTPWLQVKEHRTGAALGEEVKLSEYRNLSEITASSDRVNRILNSGAIVSVSIRPQREAEFYFYALYISVQDHSSRIVSSDQ